MKLAITKNTSKYVSFLKILKEFESKTPKYFHNIFASQAVLNNSFNSGAFYLTKSK